ncbi:hypothetical protein Tco_1483679 [Tanacetum coccineum]
MNLTLLDLVYRKASSLNEIFIPGFQKRTNTLYSIGLNTPYRSVECQFDTSYPTSGYGVSGIMEMESDIENMTLDEYREYEAKKERRLWDNVRSKNSPRRNTNHESDNLLKFPIFPATNEISIICEQDVDLEKKEVEVEDDNDGDTYDIWDITV